MIPVKMKKYKIDFKLPCKASYICLTSDLCQLVQRNPAWELFFRNDVQLRLINSTQDSLIVPFLLCK